MKHRVKGIHVRNVRFQRIPSTTNFQMPRKFFASSVCVIFLLKESNQSHMPFLGCSTVCDDISIQNDTSEVFLIERKDQNLKRMRRKRGVVWLILDLLQNEEHPMHIEQRVDSLQVLDLSYSHFHCTLCWRSENLNRERLHPSPHPAEERQRGHHFVARVHLSQIRIKRKFKISITFC